MTLTQITEKGIKDGEIINADINASAAIAGTKISPTFTSNVTISNNDPSLIFTDGDATPNFKIRGNGGHLKFIDTTNNNADRLVINNDGHVDVFGNLDVSAGIDVTGNITVSNDLTVDGDTLYVDSTNNRVGIETLTPNNTLDVHGGIVCSPNTDGKDTFELSTHAADEGRLRIKNVDTTTIQLRAGGVSYLNGGNIGIGTTSPTATLHVAGDTQFTTSTGVQHPFNFRNDFTPNSYRSDLLSTINVTSNNALRIGSVASSGGVTLQGNRANDSSAKVNLILNPDGANVGIGTTSPAQLFHVNGQTRVGTLGVNQDAGSSTIGVNGNINISPSGNTSYQKFTIDGSQVTTGSKLTINNYGDVEGDYYFFGVNATLNSSGSNIKTNDSKRHAGLYLDGRMGAVHLTSSQTSTSTINTHYTFDRNGNFSLAGNVVLTTNGAGIDFSANGDVSGMTNELLDDYEEGTWTAVPQFGGSLTGGSYGIANCFYTKIGRSVTLKGNINFSSRGSSTGDFIITGAPFNDDYSGNYSHSCGAAIVFHGPNGDGSMTCFTSGTQLRFRMHNEANDNQEPQHGDFDNDTKLMFSVTYFTNS